jgi:predicted RNA binding protein YcfA (HicA-like mRNA interferase family)
MYTPDACAAPIKWSGNCACPSTGSGHAFESLGWKVQKGSHIILIKDGQIATLSVPDHKEIAKGTLRSLIRSAGLTVPEFLDVLKK